MRYTIVCLLLLSGCASGPWYHDDEYANWHRDYGYCQMNSEFGNGLINKQRILDSCLRSKGWYE